jgi:hypothetical protein
MPELPKPIEFGPCPKCKTPLRLGLIEPLHSGYEKRMYECLACGHWESETVKNADPDAIRP